MDREVFIYSDFKIDNYEEEGANPIERCCEKMDFKVLHAHQCD